MRTIKFRGKRIDGKGFAFGSLILPNSENENTYIQGWNGAKFKVIPETVGQFTGLHDKNGKEIYEGDIVNWGMHLPNSEERFHRYAIVEFNPDIQFKIIFYINSQNGVKKETDGHIFRFGQFTYKETEKHLQVLGNIYENPELLTD